MADPAGLDAAIDAAQKAYDRNTYGEVAADHDEGIASAVRAAAPHLVRGERAAALREAADAVDGTFPRDYTVQMAAWLRERAGRIGGGGVKMWDRIGGVR